MRPWKLLSTTKIPDFADKIGQELRLYRRGDEFAIKAGRNQLMNSRVHGSEDALAELACRRLADRPNPCVLIGGLGMGFTLAAALQQLGPDATVIVAELVPAVVTWNREILGSLANHPLEDPRVTVIEADVGQLIHAGSMNYDAILLDVDNGPEGLTRKENDSLYSTAGLKAALIALKSDGIFGVWSVSPDLAFSKRLRQTGFKMEEIRVRARGQHGGGRHSIWLGTKC